MELFLKKGISFIFWEKYFHYRWVISIIWIFITLKNENIFEPYIEKVIDLKENELCIIEIKNQFPPSTIKTEKCGKNEKQPTNFYQMIKGLIKKAKIFKQFYDFRNEKIDSIRLILFYDAIHKEVYYEDLKRAFSESFEESDKSRLLYKFQCIYIKSSYLAAGLFNMYDRYNFLSYNMNEEFKRFKTKKQDL